MNSRNVSFCFLRSRSLAAAAAAAVLPLGPGMVRLDAGMVDDEDPEPVLVRMEDGPPEGGCRYCAGPLPKCGGGFVLLLVG